MAKCVIIFEDDVEGGIKVEGHLDPASDASHPPTEAQRIGWTFFKSIQQALDVPDSEVENAPQLKELEKEKS
jgi:hypothetical protein